MLLVFVHLLPLVQLHGHYSVSQLSWGQPNVLLEGGPLHLAPALPAVVMDLVKYEVCAVSSACNAFSMVPISLSHSPDSTSIHACGSNRWAIQTSQQTRVCCPWSMVENQQPIIHGALLDLTKFARIKGCTWIFFSFSICSVRASSCFSSITAYAFM